MNTVTSNMLQEMTDKIVKSVNPRRVILFGSHARGTAQPQSDVDFLIVKDEPFESGKSRRQEMAKVWRILAHYPVSQDVLIFSQDEIIRWSQSKNHLVSHALEEGIVLYERT